MIVAVAILTLGNKKHLAHVHAVVTCLAQGLPEKAVVRLDGVLVVVLGGAVVLQFDEAHRRFARFARRRNSRDGCDELAHEKGGVIHD